MNDTFQKRVDVATITMRLAELCPKAIFVYEQRRQPLVIGIRDAILARVGDRITPQEFNAALRAYTRNIGYLRAMAQPGAMGIDLEGNPVEAVTEQQAASAAKGVAAHWARQAARKAAARADLAAPAPRPVHSSPAPMSEKPRRLSLADLRTAALARKAVAQ
jgi:sRNA-binding protein